MKKITSMILAGAICASFAFGADFSKKSNDDLVQMAGIVAPKDVPDYKIELNKRMKTMKKDEAMKFHQKLEEAMKKNTDNMTLKEFRERREAVKKAIDAKKKTMTKEQLKASGLDHHYQCDMDHQHKKSHDANHKHSKDK
ncbi:hypothetical protein BKH41_01540 [Helicobacter sp. 12S02232-10]|uniref:DUF1104 domain-containing protein n=1 Tax=Helicobacter sp. 12S02232-10 TaxID=1476197 RepID=UPI000BA791AA|nr:DUF1104 domain-containing protein [Helicobacter sp. 12S02232-10]PAF49377.1 hypothetical protein BKH41_01540 [Helicobacter sp. 12S02232-10]